MKTGSRLTLVVVACLTLTMFACSRDSSTLSTQEPDVNTPAQDPVTTTAEPVLQNPTSTPTDNELSESEILQIVRSSLAGYPWRLDQSVLVKATQQTTTSRTDVQSSRRGYNQSVQTVGSETIIIESILIDSMLYLKITGSPAETYGLIDGQWAQVPPDSPLAQLADTSAVDPAKIAEIFATDFASMRGESGADEMLFEVVGSEEVDGIPTTVYESKGATFTYRWWIGVDGRFYKTTVNLPEATRTILIEYDPGINIQPPIP
jgi:hypothetical protein